MLELVGAIVDIQTIAIGSGIWELQRLEKKYGKGRWRKGKGLLGFDSSMAASTPRKSTGMMRTASAAKKPRSSASTARQKFVVCLSTRGYAASLEARKIYRAVPDRPARRRGMLRVIDESGESYLYPAERFGSLALPPRLARALSK